MPSFDVVSRVDMQEMDNAVNQVKKEIATRFDFRGSKTQIDLDRKEGEGQHVDRRRHEAPSHQGHAHRQGGEAFHRGGCAGLRPSEKAGGDMVRQTVTLPTGSTWRPPARW